MAKDKKILDEKEIEKKVKELKIELLKSPTKRARIKKEIARLLTMANASAVDGKRLTVDGKTNVKSEGKV